MTEYVLTLSCPDALGLVRIVSQWLFEQDCNIIDSDQYGDADSGQFFMRVHFSGAAEQSQLDTTFSNTAQQHHMQWQIWPCARKTRVLIMVSKLDHCLRDLLYRTVNGELPIDIVGVVSNHESARSIAEAAQVPFLHLPVTADNKADQEQKLLEAVSAQQVDCVVLARYMQILSAEFCRALPGKIINIHHSFLPSFKGARPYHQAHAHGVKLIGATAHYVTADLDEGPIIEQGVERVNHRTSAEDLVAVGRDIERMVLAKAVRYHAEHRILLNDAKTVVF